MLLTWLIHGVTLDGGVKAAGLTAPRGTSVDATFGEMDNLQILAEILTNSPVSSQPDSGLAGPPFQMPYNLNSSSGEANLWRRQQDLLQESSRLVTELLGVCALEHQPYLQALGETDDQLIALNHRILADMADPPRRWF